jgi:hypothetical protein
MNGTDSLSWREGGPDQVSGSSNTDLLHDMLSFAKRVVSAH